MEWAGTAHISRGGLTRSDAPVLSVDTGSRALGEVEAGSQVAGRAARALADCGTLYKTMDSTLRGHVREELSAAFRASRRQLLVVAPAPTRAGLTLGGNRVRARQAGGRQFLWPGPRASGAHLAHPGSGRSCPGTGHRGAEDASAAEMRAAAGKARVLVLDASSQQALNDRVAQLSLHACLGPGRPAWRGRSPSSSARAPPRRRRRAASRVLVVVSSANRVSHEQCAALQAAGAQHPGRRRDPRRRLRRVPAGARATDGDSAGVLAGLVRQARRALMAHSFDALIATGGDTMAALLDAQGIHAFTLLSELEPGFPLGVTGLAGRDRSLLLAMKAGGFGGPGTARRRLAPARSITVPFLLEPSMSASALPMAVTMGDPSGIGPEIVAKTCCSPTTRGAAWWWAMPP